MLATRRIFRLALVAVFALAVHSAAAITVRIDYSTDTNGLFPAGSPGRATLEAVASFYSTILEDTFSPIQTPEEYVGATGTVEWHWSRSYTHPTSGIVTTELDVPIAADDFPIFVGGRNILGNTIGVGGTGGRGWQRTPSGTFTGAEQTQWMNIENQFVSAVEKRQEPSGFANWGGWFMIDTSLSSGLSWHFDHTTLPANGTKIDLYSVALHEIGHALGFGNIAIPGDPPTVWQTLINPSTHRFLGAEAMSLYGSQVPLEADDKHWANNSASKTFEGFVNQEAAMDPSLTTGTRKRLTLLDAAALIDLGWDIDLPEVSVIVPGDYNGDGFVDSADYTVWRNNLNDPTEADINFAGNGTGGVTEADYTWWKARYGNGTPPGGGGNGLTNLAATSVPEPRTLALLLVGAVGGLLRNSRFAARRG